ncbi:rhodanese-like domain-containing protein [Roseobacter litoralis]|uniref:Rhodanese-like protein n=1 Tax=Roseobacter litoralis (strain ATCC 49566 / DSM 6996 / JCM 21268 / NBRC 15278 / OCh 149) TaxID=391595 RepID=F7ZMG5_ROSLO|nr:rhodanese-like domain-containing protein [Roseobacter litoralis]AEI96502.1 rhodanese-like protein [Roseobacter litoralis Och 149]
MKKEMVDSGALETWTPEEVEAALRKGEIVLEDVRKPAEYTFEHVEGALLLPMAFFDPRFLPEDNEQRLILMCGSSARLEMMARKTLQSGAKRIAHLEGGFGAWKDAKLDYVAADMASGAPVRKSVK